MAPQPTGDENERSAWEFGLLGQNAFNWILSGSALLAAAELSLDRFAAALRLQEELFRRDAAGLMSAIGRRLTQEEVDLLPDVQLGPVALMLLGFGIENWAKGLMVHSDPSLVRASDGVAPPLKDHGLERLARACGQIVDAEEERALRRISQYTIWAGRYPIPTKPLSPVSPGDAAAFADQSSIVWLWERGQGVVGRLRNKIQEEFPHAAV